MIKVIASDFDGTLLGDNHLPDPETALAIKKAKDAGIRFIGITGRNYHSAAGALAGSGIVCDYILASGAEIRDPEGKILKQISMDYDLCREVYEKLKDYPVSISFIADEGDYMIGTKETIEEGYLTNMTYFFHDMTPEETRKDPMFRHLVEHTAPVANFEALAEAKVPVYKIFLASCNPKLLKEIGEKFTDDARLAIASSFDCNLEFTDVRAQKGPVLKEYIESLGYTMDEVMVFGDSMNDYSMLSMDFGATVAMENAGPEVKAISKYITRSNDDLGVAYAIEELLKRQ